MIRFVTTRGHGYTLNPLRGDAAAPRFERVDYDRLIAARTLPRRAHVFTDLDRLSSLDLELAASSYLCLARAGVRVLNQPARVKGRYALLRALHEAGINDFNVYRVDEGVRPERYPVFLRRQTGHAQPLSGLLGDWDAVCASVETQLERGVPASSLLLVEYAAEPVVEGLFRKLAYWRVGDRYVPGNTLHNRSWNVKRGVTGIAPPELYEDALRIAREDPFGEVLRRAFEIAEIDYGRADFGLLRGRPQIYEINTNPMLPREAGHPSPAAVACMRRVRIGVLAALRRLDGSGARGRGWGRVRTRGSVLRRYRGRRLLGARARLVP